MVQIIIKKLGDLITAISHSKLYLERQKSQSFFMLEKSPFNCKEIINRQVPFQVSYLLH